MVQCVFFVLYPIFLFLLSCSNFPWIVFYQNFHSMVFDRSSLAMIFCPNFPQMVFCRSFLWMVFCQNFHAVTFVRSFLVMTFCLNFLANVFSQNFSEIIFSLNFLPIYWNFLLKTFLDPLKIFLSSSGLLDVSSLKLRGKC